MKPFIACSLLIFIISISCLGQKEMNNWFFGYNAGLNFSNGTPIFQSGGQVFSPEGCSAVSDDEGNLLFYTDGIRIWDRRHELMPNTGAGLSGDTIASQSALIVRYPGSRDLYYVFTVGSVENDNGNLSYSIVDMRLNSGYGDLVAGSKNIELVSPVCEKITAIKHANANDIWLITHTFYTNEFHVYYINCRGLITTPAIYNIGEMVDGQIGNALGYIKGSPDGSKLAIANLRGTVELFDFNNETGSISGAKTIGINPGKVCRSYGLEFSPDSKLLYVSSMYNCGGFGEFDISQFRSDYADINSTKQVLISGIGNPPGALQLASDNKIYIAFTYSNFLGAINNPNVYGPGCNLVQEQVSLFTAVSGVGLPNAVSGFTRTLLGADTSICGDFHLALHADLPNTSYLWSDGSINNNIEITEPGSYWLEIETNEGCNYQDTFAITEMPGPLVELGNDTSICQGSSLLLDISNTGDNYIWQDHSTQPLFTVNQPGKYYVEVEREGCTGSDTIRIAFNSVRKPSIGEDREVCPGQELLLDAGADSVTYLWDDGSTERIRKVFLPGRYSVTTINECGSASDEIILTKGPCKLRLPNAFTPAKSANNIFRLSNAHGLKDFRMQIYNRWGQLVFESFNSSEGWNGTRNGNIQPAGAYVFIVSYTDPELLQKEVFKGTVLLIL